MAQPEVYSFNMGSNIIGTFTELSAGSFTFHLDIQGSGYMYNEADDFTPVGGHSKSWSGLISRCIQSFISVPNGIRSIAEECFQDVGAISSSHGSTSGVDQIQIGEDVEYLGRRAFYSSNGYGSGLKSVVLLGDNPQLREVRQECFENQYTLTTIMFRGYVDLVGNKAFKLCQNLQEIGLADDYQYNNQNGGQVFYGCRRLTSISQSNTLLNINEESENYTDCNSLQYITIRDQRDSVYDPYSPYEYALDLYVAPFAGVQCDSDGDLITYLYTPFDWYFNEDKVHWKSVINRHIIQITPFSVYVYHMGRVIQLHGYDSGDIPVLHEGQWKWLNVARDSCNPDYSPVHFTHNGQWYQFKY